MKMKMLLLVVGLLVASALVKGQSFIEGQLTAADGSQTPNLVARPTINIAGRWNLQGLAYVSQDYAEMYVGPQYLIIQPADSLGIIQMCLSAGIGLEQADEALRLAFILEAFGADWDGLAAIEYGSSGLYWKGQSSHKVFGAADSFVGLGFYGESATGLGPRLTWTKVQPNNQMLQLWCNLAYDRLRSYQLIGATYLW